MPFRARHRLPRCYYFVFPAASSLAASLVLQLLFSLVGALTRASMSRTPLALIPLALAI